MDSPEMLALKAELMKMSKEELVNTTVAYIDKAIELGAEVVKLKKLILKDTY